MELSKQPYKGARDFYPPDKRRQDYMFGVMRKTAKKFGYEEYDAPILEPLEMYIAKSGEEIVNEQTYAFKDRGGRDVAIRPEMTPTVSRMVAAKRQELSYPLRWFSIPNLWRYERPQRGRLREHWQLNVDLFGISGIEAELELIMLAHQLFLDFNATESMFEIRVNNRQLMNYLFKDYLGLTEAQSYTMAKLIDRKHKMNQAAFIGQLDALFTPSEREEGMTEKLLSVLSAKTIDKLPPELRESKPAKDLEQLVISANNQGVRNIIFDVTVVRGFDYYNSIVFELFDTHPDNNRAMMGGGRYDGLVGLFGVEPVATVGFGMGDATLANFLDLHGLMPELPIETDIYVAVIGEVYEPAIKAVSQLRSLGVNAAIDFSGKKLGDQLKTAEKKSFKYVLIIGSQEVETEQYTLRDLSQSNESKHSLERIVSIVLDRRSKPELD